MSYDRSDGRNLCYNYQTESWEYLTYKEYHRLKHGYDRSSAIDDWTLYALDGGRFAVTWAFTLDYKNDVGAINWLSKLFDSWPTPIQTGAQFFQWRENILDINNFDACRQFYNEFHILAEQMRRQMSERQATKKELDDRTMREASKIQRQLRQMRRATERRKERKRKQRG